MLKGTKDDPIVIIDEEQEEEGEVGEPQRPHTSGPFRLKGRTMLPQPVASLPSRLQRQQQVLTPGSYIVDVETISDSEEGEIIEEHITRDDPGYRLLRRLGGNIDSASMHNEAFNTSDSGSHIQ